VILRAACAMVVRIADKAVFRIAERIFGQMVCQAVEKTAVHAIQQAIRATACLTALQMAYPIAHQIARETG